MASCGFERRAHYRAGWRERGRARGRVYYAQKWRLRLQNFGEYEAVVRVQGSEMYRVEFLRDRSNVLSFCDCPYAGYEADVICKHIVAAALFLRDHLSERAPVLWESVLSQVARTSSSSAPKRASEFLFFSLQARGGSWAIVLYTVPSTFFPKSAQHNVKEAARIAIKQKLSSQAEKVSPYESGARHVYANVTHTQAALVRLLASSGIYYGNYYSSASLDYGAILTQTHRRRRH